MPAAHRNHGRFLNRTNRKAFLRVAKLWNYEDGVTAIEYALLSALIVAVIISAIAVLGESILALWGLVADCLNRSIGGSGTCR